MSDDKSLEDRDFFERRLTAVETKLAYLEDFVESLQTAVMDHDSQLEFLKKENRRLCSKIAELEESGGVPLQDRRPPHY